MIPKYLASAIAAARVGSHAVTRESLSPCMARMYPLGLYALRTPYNAGLPAGLMTHSSVVPPLALGQHSTMRMDRSDTVAESMRPSLQKNGEPLHGNRGGG